MEEDGCDVKFKNLFEQVQTGNKPIVTLLEAKHLHLSNNITCKPLPQYLQQGFPSKRSLQEIL